MTPGEINALRRRAAFYLSDEVAAVAGLTREQLQQFVAGMVWLSDRDLIALARRMGVRP